MTRKKRKIPRGNFLSHEFPMRETIIFSASVFFCSCSTLPIQPPTDPGCATPLVAIAIVDQTKSMRSTSTAMPTVEDFNPLIDKLATCGGDLNVTFVRDRAEQGGPKLHFPEPPPLPEKPVQGSEEEDFEFGERMAIYGRKLLDWGDAVERSRKELEPAIERFREELQDRLERPMADVTDFNSALNDARVFLGASGDAGWRNRPANFLIINSDALDERRKPLLNIEIDAEVFWINASTSDEALKGLRFKRCDSFAVAVRMIANR